MVAAWRVQLLSVREFASWTCQYVRVVSLTVDLATRLIIPSTRVKDVAQLSVSCGGTYITKVE